MTKLATLCSLILGLLLLYVLSIGPIARLTFYPLNQRYERAFNRIYAPILNLRSTAPALSTPIDWYVRLWAPWYDIFLMPVGVEPYPAETPTPSAPTSFSQASP